jgi:polyisoprenoid-binding protein YceI
MRPTPVQFSRSNVPPGQNPPPASGADASGTFNRADFGINFGQQMGFKQEVKLAIQVEAVKAD